MFSGRCVHAPIGDPFPLGTDLLHAKRCFVDKCFPGNGEWYSIPIECDDQVFLTIYTFFMTNTIRTHAPPMCAHLESDVSICQRWSAKEMTNAQSMVVMQTQEHAP
jgi:hypothetical protein